MTGGRARSAIGQFMCNKQTLAGAACGSLRVEPRMGAVAWGQWPTPRFPSPLIAPDVPNYGIRLSDWLHRETHGERTNQARHPHTKELSLAPRPSSLGRCLALLVVTAS